MNRRKPVKKDYFALIPSFSSPWLMWSGLLIFLLVAVIWIIQAISRSGDVTSTGMAGEDIVAIVAMIVIPLAVVFGTLFAFQKITGLTIISGVEWVGKKTLAIIDWFVCQFKQLLGLEINKSNQRVTPRNKPRTKPRNTPRKQVEINPVQQHEPDTEIQPNLTTEPLFSDFQDAKAENNTAITDFSSVDSVIDTATIDSGIVETTTPTPLSRSTEKLQTQESIPTEDKLQPADEVEDSFADLETELKTFFPDTENWGAEDTRVLEVDDNDEAIKPQETLSRQNVDVQAVSDEAFADDMQQGLYAGKQEIESTLELDAPVEEESIEIESIANVQQPNTAQKTNAFSPDSLANDPDFIARALLAVENAQTESVSQGEEVEQIDSEPSGETELEATPSLPKEPDFMIKALQEAKEKAAGAITNNETKSANSSPSLFDQAEKTAASIISSFSQRFSRSFNPQQQAAYQLPSIELLQQHEQSVHAYTSEELDIMSRSVERVLNDYKVSAEVVGAYPGPVITRFELSLAPGVKVSRVNGLAKDLARAMLVTSVRVVDIIEGTPYIGLEIPNQERELVSFREIISSEQFQQAKSPITLALGKDVSGQTVVADLAKMPHLLVAGTTGSGKSVAINTMILSMLYKATPDQVRMIMVDPKMLELSIYEGIPHLLTPVVTDMNEAQNALRWAVAEMERRYKLMSKVGVRNLGGFNQKITDAAARGETIRDPLFQLIDPLEEGETFPVLSTLPNIVIVIDELADMMMIVGKKVEELIARLAQKARAAGIHLILATQRPSVDVLTGLIKANVPTRISFQVSSRIDSRTILDQGGAEALLGNGDMLFLPSGTSVPTRSHGAFVDDHEVHAVVDYLKSLGKANYLLEITQEEPAENTSAAVNAQDDVDALYADAVSFVLETGRASISSVQRRFKVGYNRAARMIDQMEEENIVSEPEGNGSRRVLDRE